jgi:hypothetical protein
LTILTRARTCSKDGPIDGETGRRRIPANASFWLQDLLAMLDFM